MDVNVLGTLYEISRKKSSEDKLLTKKSAYCDVYSKKIVLIELTEDEKNAPDATENIDTWECRCILHELVHAFLFESGLWDDSNQSLAWAMNEEMVDWIAAQLPKIMEAYNHVLDLRKESETK